MASRKTSISFVEKQFQTVSRNYNNTTQWYDEDGDDDVVEFSVKTDVVDTTNCSEVITGDKRNIGTNVPNVGIENDENVELKQEKMKRKTNHWRWMCVFGSFFIHAIIQGCFGKSSGIIQLRFEEEFNSSTGDTTWVFSVALALQLLLGPLTSTVCNLSSCRTSVIVGGIILTVGLIVTGFSKDLWLVFISYGIIGGVGRALSYSPAITIIGMHFKEKSGFPVGLASSGSGFGSLIFPFIVDWVFNYYGFNGALIILSGIVLNICVLKSLFKPKRENRNLIQLCSSQEIQHPKRNIYNRFTSVVFHKPITMTTTATVKDKKKMFNIKILKNPTFTLFCIGLGITCGNKIFHFLPSMVKQKNITDLQTTSLLAISGIFETLSRIFAGLVFDTKFFKAHRLIVYNGMMYAFGFLTLILPHINEYIIYAVLCAVLGAIMGATASQKTVIIIDILGSEHICDANGILTFFRGVGVLIGPPLSGILKDIYGGYTESFYIAASFTLVGSVFITIGIMLPLLQNRGTRFIENKVDKYSYERF